MLLLLSRVLRPYWLCLIQDQDSDNRHLMKVNTPNMLGKDGEDLITVGKHGAGISLGPDGFRLSHVFWPLHLILSGFGLVDHGTNQGSED